MTQSIGKSCLVIVKDRIVLSLRPPLRPRCVLKPLILQENCYGTGYRQAPDFALRRYWVAVLRLLINSTSNSTPMVKRGFCSSADGLRTFVCHLS